MRVPNTSKWPCRRTVLSLVVVAGLVVNLILHGVWARLYCELNSLKLQTAAMMAVEAGIVYLPADSRAAVSAAGESARRSGVTRAEIVFAGASPDNRTLTIGLNRVLPWYVTFVADLPGPEISVVASAHATPDSKTLAFASEHLPLLH